MSLIDDPVKEIIIQNFDLSSDSSLRDEELFQQLVNRIGYMLAHRMETFMSLMYRLDVSETKVAHALSPKNDDPPPVTLAKLIIERQTERMITKEKYKQSPIKDWLDF